jgi:hypothetical protein
MNTPKLIHLHITLNQSESDELIMYVIKNCVDLQEFMVTEVSDNNETIVFNVNVPDSRLKLSTTE